MKIITGKVESAQKIVLYGPEGIGKSTFASHFPGALFIDTEGSTKHLDVARTPTPSSWTMLMQQVDYVKKNPDICQTLVLDTTDWAERLCIDHICARDNKKGLEDWGYGNGYTYLAEEFGRLLNRLNELIELGVNVFGTAHAHIKRFEQPDEMGAYDRWELKLQRKTVSLVKEWADMILFANYKTYVVTDEKTKSKKAQGGKRVMYTTHHPAWDAKNRYNLPEELPLDFNSIAHVLPNKKGAQKTDEPAPKSEALEVTPEPPTALETRDEHKEIEKQSTLPKALLDLMKANEVTVKEIQEVVAQRGYYPKNTPVENYDPNFIDGVLIGAWPQVFAMIEDNRVPF